MRKALVLLSIFYAVLTYSCNKSNENSGIASITFINASIDIPSIVVNFSSTAIPFYQNQAPISNASSIEFGINSGISPISIVSSNDTTQDLFQGDLNLKLGGIYSFYLAGQLPKYDTLFMQDTIPIYNDSSSGVRFINLVPDSKQLSIVLTGNTPSQTEFSGIEYKQFSSFKKYLANDLVGGSYNFEVREQASVNLLTTFTWNFSLFKNNTLVISGLESDGTISVFQINNF